MRSAPTTTRSISPSRISGPAMLSVMTVVSMPSRSSSHAVSRAPCRNGRVSSASTRTCLPCSTAARIDAERGAVPGGGKRAGVAVREHARDVGHDRRRRSRRARGSWRRLRRGCAAPRARSRSCSWSTDSPASTPAAKLRFIRSMAQNRFTAVGRVAGHHVAHAVELDRQLLRARGLALPDTEREPHRRGHADGRRAADHHRLDGLRDLLRAAAADVDLLARQLALIDHHDGVVGPLDCREHGTIIPKCTVRTCTMPACSRILEPLRRESRDATRPRTASNARPRLGRCCGRRDRRLSTPASNGSGSSCAHHGTARSCRRGWPGPPRCRRANSHRICRHAPQAASARVCRPRPRSGETRRWPSDTRLEHRDPLGAHRQAVAGVLDVAAGDDRCRPPFRAPRRP